MVPVIRDWCLRAFGQLEAIAGVLLCDLRSHGRGRGRIQPIVIRVPSHSSPYLDFTGLGGRGQSSVAGLNADHLARRVMERSA